MRLIILLAAIGLSFSSSYGQTFDWLDGDTMMVKLENNTYVELKMQQRNLTSDSLKLGIEVVKKDIPSSWDGMVCIEGFCLGSILDVGEKASMVPVYGDQTGFVRLTVNPMNGTEEAELRIRVYDLENPSNSDTATWLLNSMILSIKDYSVLNSFEVFPNPSNDIFKVTSSKRIEKVVLSNISGQEVLESIATDFSSATLTVSGFPAGIYVMKSYNEGTLTGMKKVVVL
jgi:hypothetical protein